MTPRNGHSFLPPPPGPPQYTLRADNPQGALTFSTSIDRLLDKKDDLLAEGRDVYLFDQGGLVARWLVGEEYR